jgi:hypothetical protein
VTRRKLVCIVTIVGSHALAVASALYVFWWYVRAWQCLSRLMQTHVGSLMANLYAFLAGLCFPFVAWFVACLAVSYVQWVWERAGDGSARETLLRGAGHGEG